MGKLLGLGAKSGCGFFISKSKMASKMATKKDEFSNFLHIGVKDPHIFTHFYVVLLSSNLQTIIGL